MCQRHEQWFDNFEEFVPHSRNIADDDIHLSSCSGKATEDRDRSAMWSCDRSGWCADFESTRGGDVGRFRNKHRH